MNLKDDKCEDYQKLLSRYLDGEVINTEVLIHLKECCECQKFVKISEILKDYIKSAIIVEEVPTQTKENIINNICQVGKPKSLFINIAYTFINNFWSKPLFSIYFSLITSILLLILATYIVNKNYTTTENRLANSILQKQDIEILSNNIIRFKNKSFVRIKLNPVLILEIGGSNTQINVKNFTTKLFEFEQASSKIYAKLQNTKNANFTTFTVIHNIANFQLEITGTKWQAEFLENGLIKVSVAEGNVTVKLKREQEQNHLKNNRIIFNIPGLNAVTLDKDGNLVASGSFNPISEPHFHEGNEIIIFR